MLFVIFYLKHGAVRCPYGSHAYSCSGSVRASPMKIELSMVNTMAWMKHTSTSRVDMNTLMMTLTPLMPRNTPMGFAATRKMMHTSEMAMA